MGTIDGIAWWARRRAQVILLAALTLLVLATVFPPLMAQNQGGQPYATGKRGFLLALEAGYFPDYPRLVLEIFLVAVVTAAAFVGTYLFGRDRPRSANAHWAEGDVRPSDHPDRPNIDTTGDRRRGNVTADQWPWRRVSVWVYNWYLLLTIWCFAIPLRILVDWGQLTARRDPSNGTLILAIRVLVIAILLYFVLDIRRLIRQSIGEAADLLQTVLIGLLLLDGAEIFLALVSDGIIGSPGPAIIALIFHFGLLLLAWPLHYPRFAAFGTLLNQLARRGVPQGFVLTASSLGKHGNPKVDSNSSSGVGRDEQSLQFSWGSLLRGIAVGRVTLPAHVCFVPERGGGDRERTQAVRET